MLSTKIRTTIVALVAAGSMIAAVAPQATAAANKPSTTPSARVTVAIWTTKIGGGPATCHYPDGAPASEGEEATVMVFLDNGSVVSYNIVCGADGQWHAV